MFEIIKEFFSSLTEIRKNNIDPTQFDDEVAIKTDWEPLNTSSSNFDTRKLVSVNNNLLVYKTTLRMKLFAGLFMAVGIGFLSFVGPRQYGRWLPNSFVEEGLAQLCSLFFFVSGAAMLYFVSSPITIDRIKGEFIKGRRKKGINISLSDIYALQLIPSYISNPDGPDYYNYQLNIVFYDGNRVNIINYSNASIAREDSNTISNFVGKELWDALKVD